MIPKSADDGVMGVIGVIGVAGLNIEFDNTFDDDDDVVVLLVVAGAVVVGVLSLKLEEEEAIWMTLVAETLGGFLAVDN